MISQPTARSSLLVISTVRRIVSRQPLWPGTACRTSSVNFIRTRIRLINHGIFDFATACGPHGGLTTSSVRTTSPESQHCLKNVKAQTTTYWSAHWIARQRQVRYASTLRPAGRIDEFLLFLVSPFNRIQPTSRDSSQETRSHGSAIRRQFSRAVE